MLKLVTTKASKPKEGYFTQYGPEAKNHHQQLLDGYLQSHRVRNHSSRTIEETTRFLKGWFSSHGNDSRDLYTWEAMAPIEGRSRIAAYAATLKDMELTMHTMRKYIGILRGYFSYVCEHPYVFSENQAPKRIADVYGPIEQPVSEYDIPTHAYDGEQLGVPFEPERLYQFYDVLRSHYINPDLRRYRHVRARNYAMIVLAGESGIRSDEMAHLEIDHDLFFGSHQLQTRWAKGTNGSGKRARLTIFSPLARATVQYYLTNHRPHIPGFPSKYLFFDTAGGPIDYNSLQRANVAVKANANKNGFKVLEHFAWHWLRRLFATRFIERFPDKLPVLIELLGHTTGQTVHRYIRHSSVWLTDQRKRVLEEVELDRGQMET
jgi:integrase